MMQKIEVAIYPDLAGEVNFMGPPDGGRQPAQLAMRERAVDTARFSVASSGAGQERARSMPEWRNW